MQTCKGRSHKMIFLLMFVSNYMPCIQCHLTYSINYCKMAAVCIHDGRMICASTPDGCKRRSFLDKCDMYEFNCDYGTFYGAMPCDVSPSSSTLLSTNEVTVGKYIPLADESSKEKLIHQSRSTRSCRPLCEITGSWLTTELGETRDFNRILKEYRLGYM